MPFGGRNEIAPHLGGRIPPKKTIFGVWISFSSQTREKHAYYQNYCIDSNQILHSDKDHKMPFVDGPNTHITNPRWRTAAVLEKSPYLGRGFTDVDEIWHSDAVRPFLSRPTVKKIEIWKIQDGGGRHLEKSKNRHILAAFWPILTKFGTAAHSVVPAWAVWPLKISKI